MSAHVDFQKITANYRALALQERRRAIHRHRLGNGLRALFRQPWKLVFPFLVVALAVTAYLNRSFAVGLLPGCDTYPELVWLWDKLITILVVVTGILALLGVLALLGRPCHAKKIDMALVRAGVVDRYNVGPALLSSRTIDHTTVREMAFYSAGIPLKVWEEKGRAVEDILNCTFVEPPRYGGRNNNHRNYIVLAVAPGVATDNRQPLYDNEFC